MPEELDLSDAVEIEFDQELSESDYAEDFNRLDEKLKTKNLQSKEEWQERLDNYGIMRQNPGVKKFLDLWFNSRIKGYIEDNTKPEEEQPTIKRRRWSKEDENFILAHPDQKPKELKSRFTSRTLGSIAVKRSRVFRKAFVNVPKGFGKTGAFHRFKK